MSDKKTASEILSSNKRDLEDEVQNVQDKAIKLLSKESLNTVQKLVYLRDNAIEQRDQLSSAKYLAKLGGLEVDHLRLGSDSDVPLTVVIKEYDSKDRD